MPGIFVDKRGDDLLTVKMPPFKPYVKRIRTISGAKFGGDNDPVWKIPMESADELDEEFEGELIYIEPRHKILEIDPPPPPSVFKEVKETPIHDVKLAPRDFQLFGANFLCHVMNKIGFGLLGDLMGTGKTMMAIMSALQMKQQGNVNKVLCVVLAPTRPQWKDEIEKFTHESSYTFADFKTKYKQVDGKKTVAESIDDQKKKVVDDFKGSDAMFMITSYQGLQQNEEILEKGEFDMVIFDEAHTMKNRTSKTNKAAKKLIKKRTAKHKQGYNKGIEYTLFVSGTPIMNYPDEIYGLIGVANENYFGKWRDFRKHYIQLNQFMDVAGYKNMDELRDKIQAFYIRRTDKEIGESLPQIIEDDIWLDPHPKQIKLDKDLLDYQKQIIDEANALEGRGKKEEARQKREYIKVIKNQRISGSCHPNSFLLSKSEKVVDKYRGYAVKDLYDIPKFKECMDKTREIVESGYKVVIFVESRRMTVLLHKEISKFTKAVRYIGGLSDKKRERRKWIFNNVPDCRVMIANSAGSTGLNLQAGRYLINYDLPHNPAVWEQRKYRIRRLDSTHDKVFIYNLLNRKLVDEKMRSQLEDKQASFNATLENDEETSKMHQDMIQNKKKPKSRKKKRLKADDMISF